MAARGPKSDKLWAEAVRRAVLRRIENEEGKPQKIERLADKVVDMALGGDIQAIKEIGDRMDGKPGQAIEHTGADGGAIISAITVQFVGVDAKD